jgi:hypothetical protein
VSVEALPYPARKPARPGLLRGQIAESRLASRILIACALCFVLGVVLAEAALEWFSFLFYAPGPFGRAQLLAVAIQVLLFGGPVAVLLGSRIRWAALLMLAQSLLVAGLFTGIALLWASSLKLMGGWSTETSLDVALTTWTLVVATVWWLSAALCWRAFHAAHFLRRAKRGEAARSLAAAFD